MNYPIIAVLLGLVVGTLVGLTGIGGAVLMLPMLILGLGVQPIVAVGTDVVFSFFTKIAGSASHWRKGNVELPVVLWMAVGSVPAALVGVSILALARARYGSGVNDLLRGTIGVLMVVIPLLMFWQARRQSARVETDRPLREQLPPWIGRRVAAIITGAIGGLLVGITSVGSGSVIMLVFLLFFRRPTNILVGTDVFHAVILMGATGVAHMKMGTVDLGLVGLLLMGSIPGVLLGANLTEVLPTIWMRRVLLCLLILVGFRLIA